MVVETTFHQSMRLISHHQRNKLVKNGNNANANYVFDFHKFNSSHQSISLKVLVFTQFKTVVYASKNIGRKLKI